jgi:Spy/CpxP family protein refolding chaperone
MKKILFLITTVAFVSIVHAQSNQEDVDLIQALYGKDKKELVASFIKLEGAQKDAFWKLYDEYETARKNLGKKRFALLEKYAESYDTADDKKIDELMKQMFDLQVQTDKLIATYYDKMKTKTGYKAAAQFSQSEAYLLSIVRVTLLEKIPFFGQLYR